METTGPTATKVCNRCGLEKRLDSFHRDNTRRNGVDRHMSTCSTCNVQQALSKQKAFKSAFGKLYRNDLLKKHRPPEDAPCDCCGVPMTFDRSATGVCFDHCHETETMRGWICQKCNVGIGKLGDNLEGLMKAVRYLQHHAEKQTSLQRA